MKFIMPLCAAVASLGTAAHALTTEHIIQIGVNDLSVRQDVGIRGTGDPSFQDPVTGEYIFWPQYQDIVRDAPVWDKSQIATTPDQARTNIVSEGEISGYWTFDASVLDQDLTGFTSPDGTLLGTSAELSKFTVTMGASVVGGGVTVATEVLVANNLAVGTDPVTGGTAFLDVIALVAGRTPADFTGEDPTADGSSGATLLISGGANWFEDAAAANRMPDLDEIVVGQFEYYEVQFWDTTGDGVEDLLAWDELVEGGIGAGSTLYVNDFGAADGSSESTPLLPTADTVVRDGMGDPVAAPTFEFDVADATPVDVNGVDIIFFDPEIAVGYTYEVAGGANITAIVAPSFGAVADGDQMYTVTLPDGTSFQIASGAMVQLQTPVTSLRITGIDPALMLDPQDGATFVVGFGFDDQSLVSGVSQTALTVNTAVSAVPLPAALPMLLAGLAMVGGLSLRRRAG